MSKPVHPLRGIFLFVAAMFMFACMDTTTKYLTAAYAPPLVVAVRYVVHFMLMLVLLTPSQGRALFQTTRTGLVLFRAACLATGSLLVAFALKRMPVAETTACVFLSPLIVVLLGATVLRERVGVFGWLAALGGFGGILLIAHPGSGLDAVGVACAIGAAFATAVYQLLSRVLASTERTMTLLFYTALVGAVVFGCAAPFFWGGPAPSPLYWALFLELGAFGGIGHFLFTAAHRDAPASALAPMMYAQLIWAALLGWAVFGHVPDAMAIAGMVVVAVAGAAVALRLRLAARALEDAAEA